MGEEPGVGKKQNSVAGRSSRSRPLVSHEGAVRPGQSPALDTLTGAPDVLVEWENLTDMLKSYR